MPSMNKVFLAGNLTRNPELRYTPGGTAVAQFGMAVNRRFRNRDGATQEEVAFIDIETWGRQAETASEYLSKGSPVLIEGRLKLDSWESKETGERRSKLRVVGERVQFLGGRPRDGGSRDGGSRDGSSRDKDRRPRRDARSSGGPARQGRQGASRYGSDGGGPRGAGQDAGGPASSSGSGGAGRTGPASSSGSGGAGRTGPAGQDRSPAEPTGGGESSGGPSPRGAERGERPGDSGGDSGRGKDKLPPDNELPFKQCSLGFHHGGHGARHSEASAARGTCWKVRRPLLPVRETATASPLR